MPSIDRTITVPGDQQAVWDYLADFTTTEEWDPPTRTTTRVSGDGGVGTVYRNVSAILGREAEATYTVAAYDAPRRLELRGEAGRVDLHDTITIEQVGDRVRVHYTAEFRPHGLAKLVVPVLPLALKRLGDSAAAQMERCLRGLSARS